MRRLVALVLTALVLMPACASSSAGPVSATAAQALQPYVGALRLAASGSSVSQVAQQVRALDAEVQRLQRSNDLGPSRAQKIQDAATALLADFRHKHTQTPPTSPTVVTSTTAPPPTTPPPTESTTSTPTESTSPTTASETPTDSATPKKTKGNGFGTGNGNGNGNGGNSAGEKNGAAGGLGGGIGGG